MGLISYVVVMFLIIWVNFTLFYSTYTLHSYKQKGSNISTSLLTLAILFCFFNNYHPKSCEVTNYWGFDLYFLDDWWCWAFFNIPVDHLYDFFFGEMSESFAHLKHQFIIIILLGWVSFLHMWILNPYQIYGLPIFSFICKLPFTPLIVFFALQKFFF